MFLRKTFYVYFFIAVLETIFNNLISNELIRQLILSYLGNQEDYVNTFLNVVARYGFYGFLGFFKEPAYASAICIVFYGLEYIMGIKGKKEKYFHFLCFFVLIFSGSTTGIFLIPFGLFISCREIIKSEGVLNKICNAIPIMIILGLFSLVYSFYSKELDFLSEAIYLKLISLLTAEDMGSFMSASGAARSYGNIVAYRAFLSAPIWGIGLGSITATGLISSFLATFGILGVIVWLLFVKNAFCIRIHSKNLLLLLIFGFYFMAMYSVSFLYSPMMISIYLLFNKFNYDK